MAEVVDVVREAVKWYYGMRGDGVNVRLHPVFDDDAQTYAVLATEKPSYNEGAEVVVFARIDGEFVVVEEDNTDKPLVEKLLAGGIPREKIILAYDGEKVPSPA